MAEFNGFLADRDAEIRTDYDEQDYVRYAERISNADVNEFPDFILTQSEQLSERLLMMAGQPSEPRHMQALNTLKLFDRVRKVA